MRRIPLALLAIILSASALADGDEPLRPGVAVRRYTRGNVEYAIYAPKAWRKRKPVPLVIHIPMERFTPYSVLQVPYVQKEIEDAASRNEVVAVHCAVLLQAHNKENTHSRPSIDLERYRDLLGRDVGVVAEVVGAVAKEVRIEREAVFLIGSRYSAEAAVGIATRRPDLFAAVVAKEIETSTIGNPVGAPDQRSWFVLPAGEMLKPALRLPIVFGFDPGEPNGDRRQETANDLQSLLQGLGFGRVVQVPGVPDDSYRQFVSPELYAWIAEHLDEQRVQAVKRAERNQLLAESARHAEKGRLSSALTRYRKAIALEQKHALDAKGGELYDLLLAQGREMLLQADTLSPAKRRVAYRKVAKLFAGTPYGDEVASRLEALP